MRGLPTRLLLASFSLLFSLGLLETAVRTLSLFAAQRSALQADADSLARAEAETQPERPRLFQGRQLHPFLGWSAEPGFEASFRGGPVPIFPGNRLSEWAESSRRISQLGFRSQVDDYRDVDPERFVVGVFGGSVASMVTTVGGVALRDALAQRLGRPPDEVEILNFGLGGYKQPQQLITLLEAISLGIPLDLVLNLDGYNEIVFGLRDGTKGQHPLFPSQHHWSRVVELASANPSARTIELTAAILAAKREVRRATSWVTSGAALTRSAVARSVVAVAAARGRARAVALELELELASEKPVDSSDLWAVLDDECLGGLDTCGQLVVDIWERSSRMMHALSRSIGAGYVHLLQPSQYLPGSKPLSAEELAHAFSEKAPGARRIAQGYPLLLERTASLEAADVTFVDLTLIFAEHTETLYRDTCCHLNLLGNELLAGVLVEAIPEVALGL